MSRFTGPLVVSYYTAEDSNLPDEIGRVAHLHEPLVWEVNYKGSNRTVVVPKGFTTDGASVPRFLWWLMPPWGDIGTRAAILHDYLIMLLDKGAAHLYVETKKEAHQQFRLALLACKVNPIRAQLLYVGVRLWHLTQGE